MTATYYKASGRISIVGTLAAIVAGGIAALVGGFVYAVVLVYNPSAYLGLLLPLLYGAGVAAAVSFVGKRLKVRNHWVLVAISIAATMMGYLFSWIPWEWFTLSHLGSDVDPLAVIYPPSFLDILALIYENGAWTIGTSGSGGAVSGIMLGIVWLLEAAFVFGASALTAFTIGSSGVFCETCEEWCATLPGVFHYAPEAAGQITNALEARNLSVLTSAPRADLAGAEWLECDVSHCRCGATNTILVQRCTRSVDRRGNATVKKTPIVSHLLIAKEELDWVRRTANR